MSDITTPRNALRTTKAAVLPISLDREVEAPLHRQLYEQLRETILTGRLQAGSRLPATRTLARDLDISRNTVTAAFDQLLAEGYLEGRIGAGTFVTSELPEEALSIQDGAAEQDIQGLTPRPRQRGLSRRGPNWPGYAENGPGGDWPSRQAFQSYATFPSIFGRG